METRTCDVPSALLLTAAVLSIAWTLKRRYQHRLFRRYGIPGPQPNFFFGNWMQLKQDRLRVMDNWIQKYGKVFGFYEGEVPKRNCGERAEMNECQETRLWIYLPIQLGEEWKRVRSVVNPAFSSAKMKLMSRVMNDCGNTLVEVISERLSTGRATVDVTKLSQALSMDVVTKCALAWQVDCQRDHGNPIMKRLQKILLEVDELVIASAMALPVLRKIYAWIFPLLSYGRLFHLITESLRKVISVRAAELNDTTRTTADIVQLMLEAKTETARRNCGEVEITDSHLLANCFLFLAAGFETTAATLAFLLYELARHPEEQDKLFHELKSQLLENSEQLDYDDVQKLKRMDMVISECLRLYPPLVLFTSRVCDKDVTLSGYTVPAGAHVILPTWHIHHNPDIWPEAHMFIPDRFGSSMVRGEERRHPAAYVPFGLGPRECIGRRFALLELKTALAKLVMTYVFSVCKETDDPLEFIVPAVTVNPARNIMLQVTRRKAEDVPL
ncbi:cytochrome P450 3A8-like isoform X2 [Dermacentor variabilis]|uniref:cytochrome P450 3A8-like isoform X2 n=1 Tax=Dermacentor variabilis TaxID=34621 RepID=UPI003F5B0669